MKDNKSIWQQKYLEYQLLQQHIETLQQQVDLLNQQNIEISKIKGSLSSLESLEPGKEIFSQIGPGIFVKANLKDVKEVLFNVGSDILVNKKIQDAISSLESQQQEISESNLKLEEQFKRVVSRIIKLQEEMQTLKINSSE